MRSRTAPSRRQCADDRFEYRAQAADGRVVWLRDYVQVIVAPKRVPLRLRGLMLDVDDKRAMTLPPVRASLAEQLPARSELLAQP